MSREFTLRHGVAPAQRMQAAQLYWQAFGPKLGRVMGPERAALTFIERVMSENHVISASDAAGNIVGVIGYRTRSGSFVGGTRGDLRAVYGRFGAALIEALAREARSRGFAELRLDVVGENLRARALYERLGFRVTERSESRLTQAIFDFHTAFVMVRAL